MKRFFVITMLGLLLPAILFAQDDDNEGGYDYRTAKLQNLSPKKKLKVANKLYDMGSYINALKYYEEVYEEKSDNACAVSRLAKLNYELRDYQTAEKWYKTFYELDQVDFVEAKYMYALMQKYNGKCEEASTNFNSFLEEYDGDRKDEFKERVEREVEGCDLQILSVNDPERVIIEALDEKVNNPFSDYAPVAGTSDDELFYATLVSDTALDIDELDSKGVDYRSKILTTTATDDSWNTPTPLPATVNDPAYHNGNPAFTQDGNTLYFTRCLPNDKMEMECELYTSTKEGGTWTEAVKLNDEINLKKTNTTQPAVGYNAEGEEILYFVSDREDEKAEGGKDIWYAKKKGDDFSTPKNAGTINTKGDEVTPYFDSENQILYFSSDGRPSIGGLDVYKSIGSEGTWGEVENMLYPINTPSDDLYFSLDSDEKHGYVASNRPGAYSLKSETCCDDIFNVTVIHEIVLKAFIADRNDPTTPLADADMSMFSKTGETLTPLASVTTKEQEYVLIPLDPELVYQVAATKGGYMGTEEVLDMPNLTVEDTLEKVFLIDPILVKKIKLKRIYFYFDKYNLTRKYKVSLDSIAIIMEANPAFTLDIIGHTDALGTDDYNMRLAKRRAQTAADYLIAKGIASDRLSLIAKGESVPLKPNTVNGKDNPKNRAKNRRVEFFIQTNDQLLEYEIEYEDNERTDTN